ncbi:MAG: enoyl-CoA hydratase-related protein [Pseudomonadota bacterium]
MSAPVIEYAVDNGIATIALNRPERMNAWTGRLHTAYREALLEADDDPAVAVIVVTGRGRGFCVGGDSQALEGHAQRGAYDAGIKANIAKPGYGTDPHFDASFAYHFGLSKPIIAAVNGPAAGVGLALACFADLRFAVRGVRCTTAHGKLNLPAEYGLAWLLPRMIGLARANDLLLTSRVFLSDEAAELGLFNSVHDADDLLPYTYNYARQLIDSVAPESLKQTRWQIYRDLHRDVASSVNDAEALLDAMMKEPNYAEGVRAFLEKRPPRWQR